MKLKNYIIETRDPVVGYWKVVHVVEPFWKIAERIVEHHFLVWKWKTLRTTFCGSDNSRGQCRERAMLWAFEFYRRNCDVRVRKTHEYQDGQQTCTLVWENGEWRDC